MPDALERRPLFLQGNSVDARSTGGFAGEGARGQEHSEHQPAPASTSARQPAPAGAAGLRCGGGEAGCGNKRRVPDPQGPVLELLQGLGLRDVGGFYDSRVRGKLLRLGADTVAPRSTIAGASGGTPGVKRGPASALGHRNCPRHEELAPLRELWAMYVAALQPGRGQQLAAALSSMDLHGSTLEVVQSKSPGCVHLRGTVVEETHRTFRIVTREGQLRVLPKERCVFELEVLGERLRLLGPAWAERLRGGTAGHDAPRRWELP